MSYFIVKIKHIPEWAELHQSQLWELNASGLEETDTEIIAYFNDIDRRQIEDLFTDYLIDISEAEDENWMENWKENFKPQFIGDRFIIKPTWEVVKTIDDRIVIDIDPKMAFGTGTHETTQLILSILPKYHRPTDTVFDFGTGSGILAIAAEKLGSTSLLGIDIEDESIENAIENKEINDCRYVEFNKMGLHSINKSFTLILANINKHVLLSESEKLIDMLDDNGTLILSGLLVDDEETIKRCYNELQFIELVRKNEWIALVYKK